MGRALVLGGGGDGLYSVQVDAGRERAQARVARLEALMASLQAQVVQAQGRVQEREEQEADALAALEAAVEVYVAAAQGDPGGDHAALVKVVDGLTVALLKVRMELAQERMTLERLRADVLAAQVERDGLVALDLEQDVQAWCVDYTLSAAGEVATLEVPGEPALVLVAPGGRVPAEQDGQLLAREVMTPEQAFFNAAILPGWQKFYPTYRVGTLLGVDKALDVATVELDAAVSSADGLLVNRQDVLSGIPVVYMTCNAQPFEVGDRVVVEFQGQSWDSPRVIGFESNPRPCLQLPELYFPVWAEHEEYAPPLESAPSERFFDRLTFSGVCNEWMYDMSAPRRLTRQARRVFCGTTHSFGPGVSDPALSLLTPPGKVAVFEDLHWFHTLDYASRRELFLYAYSLTPGVPVAVGGHLLVRRRDFTAVPASYRFLSDGCASPYVDGWQQQGDVLTINPGMDMVVPAWDVVFDSAVSTDVEWLAFLGSMPAEVQVEHEGVLYRYQRNRMDSTTGGYRALVYSAVGLVEEGGV